MRPDFSIQVILEAEFQKRLRLYGKLRLIATLVFAGMTLVAGGLWGQPVWADMVAYSLVSVCYGVLFSQAHRLPTGLQFLNRWSAQLVDLPLIFGLMIINPGKIPFSDLDLAFVVMASVFMIFVAPIGITHFSKIVVSLEAFVLSSLALHAQGHLFPAWVPSFAALYFLVCWGAISLSRQTNKIAHQFAEASERQHKLGRYFSPAVAEHLVQIDSEEPQEAFVTVLVSDLRGFTALSEQLEADEIFALLNRYHAEMVETIFAHGGTLDKFMGDGILAYFGAPVAQEDHASRAVNCSLAMVAALQQLNAQGVAPGGRQLEIGIGLHSGPVSIGNLGVTNRLEFTIIGDTVNTASRIESLTKAHRVPILASARTAELAGESPMWTSVGDVEIRGKSRQLELLHPQALGSPDNV